MKADKRRKTNNNKRGGFIAALSNVVGIIMILFVIVCLLPAFIPKIMGREVFTVVSGSMEPEIPVGSLVIIKKADPLKIQEGDVIAFRREGTVITHRVVENQKDLRQFITKGDANELADMQPASYTNLVGKMSSHYGGVGNLMAFFSTLGGKLFLIGLILFGVLLQILAGKLRN